jgi:hypothetical protein
LGKFISYRESEERDPEKLYLEDQPFFARKFKNVISDGLTCYRTRRLPSGPWECVVKFKWQPVGGIPPESQMLRLVKENKFWGVIQLVGYQDIESTEN